MAIKQTYSWAQTELDKLIPQLQNAGVQLGVVGTALGLTPAQIAYWQQGAAVLAYLQSGILATRNFSTQFTQARDRLLIDKTPASFVLPTLNLPPQPALVQSALADPDFVTDFLDWCDKLVVGTIKPSPDYPNYAQQLGFLTPPAPPAPDAMQPTIRSFHDGPGGLVEFNVDRQNQAQVKVVVTLDDGKVIENRLPSAKIPLQLPTDRPHAFSAVATYCDKMGQEYGLPSQPFTGTSEI